MALKTYNQYHTDCVAAEGKLKEAERLEERHTGKSSDLSLGQSTGPRRSSGKKIERLMEKQLEASVTSLDQGGDRDGLMQQHDASFCLPFRFSYHPHEGDQVCEVSAESQVRYELETRFQQLQCRLAAVTLETEEVSKTLKATLTSLLDTMCDSDSNPAPDLASSLSHELPGGGTALKMTLAKRRANQQETESFYFTKVKEFLTSSSLTSKLQAKHDLLHDAIQKGLPQAIVPLSSDVPSEAMASYSQLLECVQIEATTEKSSQIKSIISSFARPLLIVIRYLFAFLNHVSQYSDENMMQPYNLAVCFGPSLLRVVESGDAVARQPQVNELVKTMIIQHDAIFPSQSEVPGPVELIAEEGDGEAEQLHNEDGEY
ncbi:hypothetical protein CRUP_011173 [Coryphaenoides rupestris]|nr:hypothetical protein CRUP_011173 [Coryphaenoides rupestris]